MKIQEGHYVENPYVRYEKEYENEEEVNKPGVVFALAAVGLLVFGAASNQFSTAPKILSEIQPGSEPLLVGPNEISEEIDTSASFIGGSRSYRGRDAESDSDDDYDKNSRGGRGSSSRDSRDSGRSSSSRNGRDRDTTSRDTSARDTSSSAAPSSSATAPAATATGSDIGADAADFDVQLWEYQNQVRADPQSMIPDLEEMLTWFQGDVIYEPGTNYGLLTNEGPAAVQELIDFLMVQEPVDELEWQHNLMYASRDHVMDTGPSGLTGHYGTDGSSPSDRMARYVTLEGMSGENIAYGVQGPERTIMSLAIDEGVPSRGHRDNIF